MDIEHKELYDLIDLAEKVSEKTNAYKNDLSIRFIELTITTIFLFSSLLIFLFYLKQDKDTFPFYIPYVSLSVFLFSLSYLVFRFRQTIRIEKLYNHERLILADLLEMTNDYKRITLQNSQISVLERALLEMRLKRINFDV